MPLNPQNHQNDIVREPLKWLFVAFFVDGNVIKQTEYDKCMSRNDGTGSAFTDVLEYAKSHKLHIFELHHTDGKQKTGVDLDNGIFVINGTPICSHNQDFDPSKYQLELIYFRETRVEQEVNATVQDDMSIKEIPGAVRHYVNRYFLGWQCIVNGRNKQVTIAVG